MSRSERMPTRSVPVSETTSDPIRSVRRRWSAPSSEASGVMVLTSRPLRARMYSTFMRQLSRRCALALRLDSGLLLELAQGIAHALEHGLLAAGHALALGCRQPQRVVPPALQDRVLLVGAEVPVRQHILRLAEHGTRIAQRSFILGHRSSSERRSEPRVLAQRPSSGWTAPYGRVRVARPSGKETNRGAYKGWAVFPFLTH